MLFKAAIVLLTYGCSVWSASIAWATSSMSSCSSGLMLLLLAMLKARDAALRAPNPPTED
jgi:hypothetical protein